MKCVPSIQGNFEYIEKLVDRLPFDKAENSTKMSTIMCKISLAIKKGNSTKFPRWYKMCIIDMLENQF